MSPPLPPAPPSVLEAAWRDFRSEHYLRHNQRRQEHLASLGLPLTGKTVLELGAGIGDHTTFFLDRGCTVTSVEPRLENCHLYAALTQARGAAGYQAVSRARIVRADALSFETQIPERFDIVYCYGLLYHTDDPNNVLKAAARHCDGLLLLETWVSFGEDEAIHPASENGGQASQAISSQGCRPTRPWIVSRLRELFAHVYLPATQPAHEEFPLDWTAAPPPPGIPTRAVFVASRAALDNRLLLERIPGRQTAC